MKVLNKPDSAAAGGYEPLGRSAKLAESETQFTSI
jgi:hypothetical protein